MVQEFGSLFRQGSTTDVCSFLAVISVSLHGLVIALVSPLLILNLPLPDGFNLHIHSSLVPRDEVYLVPSATIRERDIPSRHFLL